MAANGKPDSLLATAWREADSELQLLRRSDPLEAFERADAVRTAYLRALTPRHSQTVSLHSFWVRLAILLGLLLMVVVRVTFHRRDPVAH